MWFVVLSLIQSNRAAAHAAVIVSHEVKEISCNFSQNAYSTVKKNISFLPLISFSYVSFVFIFHFYHCGCVESR